MAKTPKLKKGSAVGSIHSRAARRATSPSIDTDKSLKSIQPPAESKMFLSAQHNAGISKPKNKGKRMTRNQRLRHEKGQDRAEAMVDQLEKKVDQSTKRARTIKERSYAWDEVNEKAGVGKKSKATTTAKEDPTTTNTYAGFEGEDEVAITDARPARAPEEVTQASVESAADDGDLDVVL